MTKDEAEKELDRVQMDLNDLWRQIREKQEEEDRFRRIVHPEDYLPGSGARLV